MVTNTLLAQENPGVMAWKVAGKLPAVRDQEKSLGYAGPVAGIHNNILLVAGGANFPDTMPWMGGKKKYYEEGYLFKKENDILIHFKTFLLPYSIAYSANCSTSQGIIAAGGENEKGISNKVLQIQWNLSSENIQIEYLPDLPLALTNAAITSNDNLVFIAGGETSEIVSDRFFCLNILKLSAGWKELPPIPKPVSHAVLVMGTADNQNNIYLIGGRKKNNGRRTDFYNTVYHFDQGTNKWQENKSLPYSLSAHSAISTGDGSFLIFGGDKGEISRQLENINALLAEETDHEKKKHLNDIKIKKLTEHNGFSRDVLSYNVVKDQWQIIKTIPFNVPVTTTAIRWGNGIIIPGGEIKPGIRTPEILIGTTE